MNNTDQLNWSEINFQPETVTPEEVADAEKGGVRVPPGKYICVITHSAPKQITTKEISCVAANLTFEIEQVLAIEGKDKVTEEDQEALESKKIWDDVRLETPGEKQTWRNRRIYIANRLGLLENGGVLDIKAWSEKVLGRRVVLTTEKRSYTDRNGQEKTITAVTWNGYEPVDSPANSGGGEAPYAGI